MILPDNCKELFLEGLADAYIYPVQGSSIPVPSCVAQILTLANCAFPSPAIHVVTEGNGQGDCIAENITLKITPKISPSGTIYTFDLSALLVDGGDNAKEMYKTMQGNDYYIVVRNANNDNLLCYTLPNTFTMQLSLTANNASQQRTLSFSLKAMSELIPITIRK